MLAKGAHINNFPGGAGHLVGGVTQFHDVPKGGSLNFHSHEWGGHSFLSLDLRDFTHFCREMQNEELHCIIFELNFILDGCTCR